MGDELPGVVITIKDIYDEVRETRSEVREVRQEVKESRKTDEDHESRIRSLERWMYGIPASIVIAIASILVPFIK